MCSGEKKRSLLNSYNLVQRHDGFDDDDLTMSDATIEAFDAMRLCGRYWRCLDEFEKDMWKE